MKQSLLGIIKLWVMLLALFQLSACGSSGDGNQPPTALDINLSTDEDTALSATLSGADSDGSIAAYTLVAQPSHGSLSGTAPTLTYTPDADYFGIDSFSFTVTDDAGVVSASGTVSITVNSVNDADPVATAQIVTLDEDVVTAITLAGSDSDGTIAGYTVVSPPGNGSLSGTAPNLTYTPDADYFGSDSFSFTVTDNDGADSVTSATVSITINSVNDVPSFVMGADQGVDLAVDEIPTSQTVVGWATDISAGPAEESGQTVSFLVSNDNNTLFSVQPAVSSDGTLSYTPATGAFGWATLSVQLQDNGGTANGGVDSTAAQTFIININTSLSLIGLPAAQGETVQAYFKSNNSNIADFSFDWVVNGGWSIASGQGTAVVDIVAPVINSAAELSLTVTNEIGHRLMGTLPLSMVGDDTPVLDRLLITLEPPEDSLALAVTAVDPNTLGLSYSWSNAGFTVASSATATWQPPVAGRYLMNVQVSNGSQSSSGTMELDHAGAAPWPFFLGARQGIGSRTPQDTRSNLGQLKWQTTLNSGASCGSFKNFVSGVAQGTDGSLYVGSYDDGKLYAINPTTGAKLWDFATAGSSIQGSPAVAADGTIYVAEYTSGIVYAVNPDGSEKWQYAAGANIVSPVAIGADGTAYVGTLNGASSLLYALNPADGSKKWSFALAGDTRSSVNFGADGTVYARDYAGNLFAIAPADGSQKWQITVGGGSGSSPSIAADGTIYFGSFLGSTASRFYAVNPDGSQKWESDLGGNLYGIGATASVGADGTVYIGVREPDTFSGVIYAVNADGTVKWRRELDYAVQASTAIGADGTVYTASQNGYVYALDPSDGTVKWTYDSGFPTFFASPGAPSIGADGSIYLYYQCDATLRAIE